MATIKERGIIAHKSEVVTGTSQSGNTWYRQTIVVEVAGFNGSYRKIALQAQGDNVIELQRIAIGESVEVTYQVTAREWNGKWYNNVDLFRIDSLDEQQEEEQQQVMLQMQQPMVQTQPMQQRRRTKPVVPPGDFNPQSGDMPF